MNISFHGTITQGKLQIQKLAQFNAHLQSLEGRQVQITVEREKRTRSHNQNAYYWSVVVGEIAKHTGHDPEQIHELLKQKFSPKWFLYNPKEVDNVGVPTSTARLDTIAFVEYTERCRLWANEFLGLQIPLPGEVTV